MLSIGILACLLASTGAAAPPIPGPPPHYVLDEPQVLSPAVREKVGRILSQHQTATGEQLVIAIFNSLQGEDLVDRTNRVFEAWSIGQKGKDNGVLLALFWQEHKARIEVGYGLEATLTDAQAKRIIEDDLIPFLKENSPDQAISSATQALLGALGSPLLQGASATNLNPPPRRTAPPPFGAVVWIFSVILVLLIRLLHRNDAHFTRAGWTQKGWRRGGWGSGGGFFPPSSGGGGWTSGGGGGGGGIFSGGGGRSGGGGASGSW